MTQCREDPELGLGGCLRITNPTQTGKEAEKMILIGRKLLETAVKSDYSGLTRAELNMILGNLEQILERGIEK